MYSFNNNTSYFLPTIARTEPLVQEQRNNAPSTADYPAGSRHNYHRPTPTKLHFPRRRRNLQPLLLLQHNRSMESNVPSRRHPLHRRYTTTTHSTKHSSAPLEFPSILTTPNPYRNARHPPRKQHPRPNRLTTHPSGVRKYAGPGSDGRSGIGRLCASGGLYDGYV